MREVQTDSAKGVTKYVNETITPAGTAGQRGSDIVKRQLKFRLMIFVGIVMVLDLKIKRKRFVLIVRERVFEL